jgi:hypothetical protein
MAINRGEFTAINFEDGSCAVVRSDPGQPSVLEVIATFYDAARAREYAQSANSQSHGQQEAATIKEAERAADLSERQKAVLSALRANTDKNNFAEVRTAPLAKAAHIPVGSLHSVLSSLEKKQLIRTKRPGSATAPASYQILDAPKR